MNTDKDNYWSFQVRTTETTRKYIRVETAVQLGCYLAGLIEAELPERPQLRAYAMLLEREIITYLETEYRSGVDEIRKAAEGVRERIINERPLTEENAFKFHKQSVKRWQSIKEARRALELGATQDVERSEQRPIEPQAAENGSGLA